MEKNVRTDLYQLNYRFAVEELDPRIGKLRVFQTIWPSVAISEERTKHEIPLVKCSDLVEAGEFDFLKEGDEGFLDMNLRHNSTLLCPNTTSLIVEGYYHSKSFSYVKIEVDACDPEDLELEGQECGNITEVMEERFQFYTLTAFLDYDEPTEETMVRYNLNSAFHYEIDPRKQQKLDVYYKNSTVKIQNNPFHLFGKSLQDFYIYEFSKNLERVEVYEEDDTEERELISVYLRADPYLNIYERRGPSMFQFIAVVSGLRQFMWAFVYICIGWMVENQFKAEIIRDTYLEEEEKKDQ